MRRGAQGEFTGVQVGLSWNLSALAVVTVAAVAVIISTWLALQWQKTDDMHINMLSRTWNLVTCYKMR